MNSFHVIINGKRYCGMQEMSQKNEYAIVWTTVWYGQQVTDKFIVTPSMISNDGAFFWNCIFENKSDGSPVQMLLDF